MIMAATVEHADQSDRSSTPPVLVLWALTFLVFSLPNVPDLVRTGRARLEAQNELGLFDHSVIWYPAAFYDLVPFVLITLVLGLSIAPFLRSYVVRRRYGLTPAGGSPPALNEVCTFIRFHLPDAVVTANLRRSRSIAFVYPEGWRTSGIAVFGGLIHRWRSDRQAAEAVLMHEIEHARQRDYVLVGIGTLLRILVPAMLVLMVLTALLLNVEQAFLYGWQFGLTDVFAESLSTFEVFTYPVEFLGHAWTLGWIIASFGLISLSVSLLVVPVAAIWVSEINADRVAGARLGTHRVVDAIRDGSESSGSMRNLLFFLHPPSWFRVWSLRHPGLVSIAASMILLPLAYLISLLLLHVWTFSVWAQFELIVLQLLDDSTWSALRSAASATLDLFWVNSQWWFTSHPTRWVFLGIVIVSWPLVGHVWRGERRIQAASEELGGAFLAGGLTLGIAAVAFVLA